ncbi:sigma-70 family RNA polymerase sigma factor [Saccharothrix carnea]|uniref:sigma-70 family RNA polymerase sigma factor n=1 Tax=Saccharothrix carnea TaxID=1280637 RepID=UPI0015E6E941|nr:sigma-70 family RNA polymerase sigma factor [Saccharothrix carnea]
MDHGSAEDLLTRAIAGDHDAFTLLYRQYATSVRGMAFTVVGDRAQAEEVAQDVFLELLCAPSKYDAARGSARSWLMMLARRRAIDRARATWSVRARDTITAARESALTAPDPSEEVELIMTVTRVLDAMRRLRPEHSEVLLLTYLGDMSQRDVAAHLRVPLGTVKSRLYLALAALRRLLADG